MLPLHVQLFTLQTEQEKGAPLLFLLLFLPSFPHAHVAPANVVPLLPGLRQRGGGAVDGGLLGLHPGQPEAVDVGEVVAGPSRALTLHKGLRSEGRQTAAGGGQRLAAALVTCTCVLQSQETSAPAGEADTVAAADAKTPAALQRLHLKETTVCLRCSRFETSGQGRK